MLQIEHLTKKYGEKKAVDDRNVGMAEKVEGFGGFRGIGVEGAEEFGIFHFGRMKGVDFYSAAYFVEL